MAFNVGAIQSKLTLDTKGWKKSIAGVRKDTKTAETRFGKLSKSVGGLATSLNVGLGTALLGVGVASIKAAIDINKSMGKVATLIPGNTKRVEELKGQIQELGPAMGKSTADLAEGAFQVISAFGDTSETMEKLEINARAAAAGMSTTKEAINLTSAVTKGYGDVSLAATQKAADLAFKTNELGQTTFPELAASIGRVIPFAAAMNVKQEELFAGFATLTGVTGTAADVSTQFAAVLKAMIKPSQGMLDALEQLKEGTFDELVANRGLVEGLRALIKTTDGSKLAMGKLFTRAEALTAVFALTGGQAGVFDEKLVKMNNSAGAMDKGFEAMTTGLNAAGFQFEQLKVSLTVAAQKIGQALLPILKILIDVLKPILEGLSALIGLFNSIPGPVKLAVAAFALMRVSLIGGIAVALIAVKNAFDALHESMKESIRLVKKSAREEASAINKIRAFKKVASDEDKAFLDRGLKMMRKRIAAIHEKAKVEGLSAIATKTLIQEEELTFGKATIQIVNALKLRSKEYQAWEDGVVLVNGKIVEAEKDRSGKVKVLTQEELEAKKTANDERVQMEWDLQGELNLANEQGIIDRDVAGEEEDEKRREQIASFEEFRQEMMFTRETLEATAQGKRKVQLDQWRKIQEQALREELKDQELLKAALGELDKTYYAKLKELREADANDTRMTAAQLKQFAIKTAGDLFNTFSKFFQLKIDLNREEYEDKKQHIIDNVEDEDERKTQLEALDEEYAAKEKELRKEAAIADKAGAIFGAIVNTSQAITKALTAPWPFNLILAGIIGAMGAAQIAMIAAQPVPFAEGGITTGPTQALIGEAGPEAVIPLDQLPELLGTEEGGGTVINFNIQSLDPEGLEPIIINRVIPILEAQAEDENFRIPTKAVRG